jgi:aminopeptidase
MSERIARLADLAVHGANVQPGQVTMVTAELGQEALARAVAAAAYDRGAMFVDVDYFDPQLKRTRIEHADPGSLSFVPPWYGERVLSHAELRGARITIAGVAFVNPFEGLDPDLVGRDMLPRVKELTPVVSDRLTNWCIVPCPHPAWAALVHPELPANEAEERLWQEIEHVLRLDEPDPRGAWEERMAELTLAAARLDERRFDAFELRAEGTELTVGMLGTHKWHAADFHTVDGIRHFPNLPTEEVFTTPDPRRTEGCVTSTKPLVLRDGTIVRGLRVRFEQGVAVEVEADENGGVLRSLLEIDEGALRVGELALVDRRGRIGPLDTIFYNTLLDENAASHIALGAGFRFAVDEPDLPGVNESAQHIDFMIGSSEMEVDGITADGERVPVLRAGDWQI